MQLYTPYLLATIAGVGRKYGKRYAILSQEKYLELLARMYKTTRSRSTLNRWLRQIEDSDLIVRTRRLRRDSNGGLVVQATLYRLTAKGFRLLRKMGCLIANPLKDCRVSFSRDNKSLKEAYIIKEGSPLGKWTSEYADLWKRRYGFLNAPA